MRWIANLIISMAVLCSQWGCSSRGAPQAGHESTFVTLNDLWPDDPLFRYLRSRGAGVFQDDFGRVRLFNDQSTRDALHRWLVVQRATIETASRNLANQATILDPQGKHVPYRRQLVLLDHEKVVRITPSLGPYRRVYDPGHPVADKDGYVDYPDIDPAVEVLAAMDASRQYEKMLELLKVLDPAAAIPGGLPSNLCRRSLWF